MRLGPNKCAVSLWERCGGGAPDQVQHAAPGRGAKLHASRRYGSFGGRYVPETLIPALDELQAEYAKAQQDPTFKVSSRASPHHTWHQGGRRRRALATHLHMGLGSSTAARMARRLG